MKHNNRCRNLRIIVVAIIGLMLMLSSCKSSSSLSTTAIPAFTATRPSRPSLAVVGDDVQIPAAVVMNQELLIGYARKLEVYADAWEQYYINLEGN